MPEDAVGCGAIGDNAGTESVPVQGVKGFKNVERKMIGRTDQVYNKYTQRYEFHRTRPKKSESFRFTKYVIVVRRQFDSDGLPDGVEVDIRGERLQKVLLELNKDVSGFGFSDDPPQIDPKALYYSLEGLEKMLVKTKEETPVDEQMIFELNSAIQYVREDFAETFGSLQALLPTNQITFDHLWTLYPPNTIVYTSDTLSGFQAYIVRQNALGKDEYGMRYLILTVGYIDSNGKDVGWVKDEKLRIPWFKGVKNIWHLIPIPLELGPEPEVMRKLLVEQGRLAIKRHGRQLVEYKGPGLRKGERDWYKFNVHGRVMLDPETWHRTRPRDSAVPTLDSISMESLTKDDEKVMLLSSFVYGYSLGDKTWGKFSVSKTAEADWNDKAFEALVLDEGLKNFIRDLVAEHKVADSTSFDDVIRDKGRGLVGLLAGPPGVGKTLTAEAVAEVSRRPLYTISSGELGHEPAEIHKTLTSILELGENWDAVVLLDEADVFLTKRSDRDLTRNAIVSVFLRELEYYQGIIILTTNMAPNMDQAFQSRIHFSLQYPDLDAAGRRRIWQNFMDMAVARNERLKIDIDDEGMKVLDSLQLNGRQIKNTMSVAQKVAQKRDQPLTVEMIQTAMSLSQHGFDSWGEAKTRRTETW